MATGLTLLNQTISASGTLALGPVPGTTTGGGAAGGSSPFIPGTQSTATLPVGIEPARVAAVIFQLTTGASVGGTFNLFVQDSVDGGANYTDFVAFQTVTTSALTPVYYTWIRDIAVPAYTSAGAAFVATAANSNLITAKSDGVLAAGSVIPGPTGDNWRLKWTVSGWSANVTLIAKYVLKTR